MSVSRRTGPGASRGRRRSATGRSRGLRRRRARTRPGASRPSRRATAGSTLFCRVTCARSGCWSCRVRCDHQPRWSASCRRARSGLSTAYAAPRPRLMTPLNRSPHRTARRRSVEVLPDLRQQRPRHGVEQREVGAHRRPARREPLPAQRVEPLLHLVGQGERHDQRRPVLGRHVTARRVDRRAPDRPVRGGSRSGSAASPRGRRSRRSGRRTGRRSSRRSCSRGRPRCAHGSWTCTRPWCSCCRRRSPGSRRAACSR